MKIINELKYSKSHEWIRVEENKVYFGITCYAQNRLGDEIKGIKREDIIDILESVKAVADIFSPISGTIVEVNTKLLEDISKINGSYDSWLVELEISDKSELNNLLNALSYKKYACIA